MNFKQWLLISEMAKISIESLNTKSLQALSENSTDYNLKARYKFLISEWDKKKNTLTPSDVTPGSQKMINWKCKEGHTWATTVNSRTSGGTNCFYCSLAIASLNKQKINDQNLKELAVYWTTKGKEPHSESELGIFLYRKRRGYRYFKNNTSNSNVTWYKTDIKVGEEVVLPDGWYLPPDKYKKQNDQKLIALGKHFKDNNNKEPRLDLEIGMFLYDKRRAYQDFQNKEKPNYIKNTSRLWYDTDKDFGTKAGLPEDWYLFTDKYKPDRIIPKKLNDQKLIALGKHFKNRKNNRKEPYSSSRLGEFLYGKRRAYQDFQNKEKPNYIKTTNYKWYETDKDFGIKAGSPEDWYLFTDKYKPDRKNTQVLKIKNDQKLIALGKHFKNRKNNGKEPHYTSPLGEFLDEKRRAYKDFQNKEKPNYKKTTTYKWYETDKDFGIKEGLPEDWYLFTDRYKPDRENVVQKQTNDQNLINLGKKFKRFGEPHNKSTLGRFLYNKRRAFQDFENDTEYTKTRWYDTDEKFGEKAGLPKGWHLPVDKESVSDGEKLVGKILKKLKLNAIRQYQDKECNIMTGRCLRFDYSFIYNDQEYFVEYNGAQHYYPIYFGSTEGMTKKEIAKHALAAFEVVKESDRQKYNYCKEINNKFPLLVIPYWINPDRFKNRILDFIKHDNVFDTLFANPLLDVPQNYKKYHKKMYEKYLADLKSTELVKQKTTFEQFLINKNFTYYNA